MMDVHPCLARLLAALPLSAEEGSIREVVKESDLLDRMGREHGEVEKASAVALIRALFESLGLLDRQLLGSGVWAFVSFPASLTGRSLLATLSTPWQTLVEPHYWEQGAHRPKSVVEEQRHLLQVLETRRAHLHPGQAAQPIRTVHVAWGVIKTGGRFLMHLREDDKRSHEKNYVFPGGRLNISDLPPEAQNPSSLRDLFEIDSALAAQSLRQTLTRELEEECGLSGQHYTVGESLKLPPHVQVEGARNNHALSQYNLHIYPVQLTEDGELQLLQTEHEHSRHFCWFTLGDLFQQTRTDGKRAFVDALTQSTGMDACHWFASLPDSFAIPWKHNKETDAIDVPAAVGDPVFSGKSGKESPKAIALDSSEWGLLLLLAWHGKQLQVRPVANQICLLGNGWIRLLTPEIGGVATSLAAKLEAAGLVGIRLRRDTFCRLDIDPQYLFFDRKLFHYELPAGDSDQRMTLHLHEVRTLWGTLCGDSRCMDLSRNLVRIVRAIENGDDPTTRPNIKSGDVDRQIRSEFQRVREIGLRKFIFNSKGHYQLAVDRMPPNLC